MNERLSSILDLVSKLAVLSLAFVTPLLFWNLTSEFYETPKFLALVVLTLLLLLIFGVKFLINGKVSLLRTPLDLPFVLILAALGLSTFFATSRTIAIFGNFPRIHEGLITFIFLVLAYFMVGPVLKKGNTVKQLLNVGIVAGVILSALSLLSFFGQNILPFSWASLPNFTPSGSSFSTTAILSILLPIPLMAMIKSSAKAAEVGQKVGMLIVLIIFAATIALTGSWVSFIVALAAYSLTLFILPPALVKKNLLFIATPILIAITLTILSLTQIKGIPDTVYGKNQGFPREFQLTFADSWKISISAFRDSPFWGTGPGTYPFNFTSYKPVEFNSSKAWNIRFDQAANEYLQFLADLGGMGLVALLLLTAAFVSRALKTLSSPEDTLSQALAISGLSFFLILALHASSLTLWIVGVLILASFMAIQPKAAKEVELGDATGKTQKTGSLKLHLDTLPTLLMLTILILTIAIVYFGSKFTLADYHRRLALNAVSAGKALDAYNQLVVAERLNPYFDIYRADLAQTNFALANAIASTKGPSAASASGSLSDADKQNIQTLLSQAISEARAAVALSPNNSLNWETLGSIYRQISGVAQNAPTFALDSYGRAIQKDPYNPNLRLTVGGIYYSFKNYDMAIRFFTDAINLKPDFANGYYNLAIALRDKGDTQNAIAVAEKTVSLLDPKNSDYKTAADLLASLKDQTSTKPAEIKDDQSALQNSKLPKVVNLPKKENIATPPAVTKSTPTPTKTPEE